MKTLLYSATFTNQLSMNKTVEAIQLVLQMIKKNCSFDTELGSE
jgi:hypothetical protein